MLQRRLNYYGNGPTAMASLIKPVATKGRRFAIGDLEDPRRQSECELEGAGHSAAKRDHPDGGRNLGRRQGFAVLVELPLLLHPRVAEEAEDAGGAAAGGAGAGGLGRVVKVSSCMGSSRGACGSPRTGPGAGSGAAVE